MTQNRKCPKEQRKVLFTNTMHSQSRFSKRKERGKATCAEKCVYTLVRRHVWRPGWESVRSIIWRHFSKAYGSHKKVNVLASLFPALKITPCPKVLFNYKYQEHLRSRPTRSPSAAQCLAKPKISLFCGGVGKPQPNKERRARCHRARGEPTEPSWREPARTEVRYLH